MLRDAVPAGVVLGRRSEPGELELSLDYVLKPYRDFKLGRWLFGPGADVFARNGIRRLVTDVGTSEHRRYLVTMGFRILGERGFLSVGDGMIDPA